MTFDPVQHLNQYRDRIARNRYINWTLSVYTRLDMDATRLDQFLAQSDTSDALPVVTREHLWLCALARVLRERPLFNAAYDGFDRLTIRDDIHLRCSLRTPAGLAYGVIHHADRLSVRQMAAAHAAAAGQASPEEYVDEPPPRRSGRLGRLLDDVARTAVDRLPQMERLVGNLAGGEAGTFTVIDAGAFGADDFQPILLRPALAMLVVLRPRQQVTSRPGPERVRQQIPMAVSICHKLMDTDAAAYFLHHLQQLLNDPEQLVEPGGVA